MTRDEARQWIPILQGYADGKHIQIRDGAGWFDGDNSMMFINRVGDYRIKPEPKLRPWTEQEIEAECIKGTVLKCTTSTSTVIGAISMCCGRVHVGGGEECKCTIANSDFLLNNYVIAATGAPCGVLE